MQVLDFIVRFIFLPVVILWALYKAVPAIADDIAGMIIEFYGRDNRSLKESPGRDRRKRRKVKRPAVSYAVFVWPNNTIHKGVNKIGYRDI